MKIIHTILIVIWYSLYLQAAEVSGKIQLKENGQLRTEEGQVYVGEVESEAYINAKNFPPYLKAMADSMGKRRLVPINKDGEFIIKDIPTGKKLLIGISFFKVHYFVDAFINNKGSLVIEEVIDLDTESKDIKVNVINETGKEFLSDFASTSYLIEEGKKGKVFTGRKSEADIIDFGKVPLGFYKLYVLNREEEGVPNRVDQMPIELTKDNGGKPFLFKIK